MRSRIFVVTSLFALSLSSVSAQTLADLDFGTDGDLDVVTWNIEHFPKDGQTTIDQVEEILAGLDADVYALQEIDDLGDFQDMVDDLPDYTAFYQSSYFAGLVYLYKPATVQITSLYEIYTASPYWSAFPRSPVVMEMVFEGEDVVVINNHFKCCGDGFLDLGDSGDEETRRLEASQLLQQYIEQNFDDRRVILTGDLNDDIADSSSNNVFQGFLDEPADYQFADQAIATGPVSSWSFPNWPSHLDHILITDEFFGAFADPAAECTTIRVEDYLPGGFSQYDNQITDHRPVAIKLPFSDGCTASIQASELFRFGSPANPFALLNGQTSGPILGGTWDPVVNHTVFFPTAILDVLIVSAEPPVNLPTPNGTVLCNIPGPNQIFYSSPGVPFAITIPDDCNLAGLALCTQAASVGGGSIQVTNGIDVVLGN